MAYKRITPKVIADFTATELIEGNGTATVRKLEDTRLAPHQRAWRIVKKREQMQITNTVDFIEDSLQQIGIDAVQRVGKLVNSADERIATKNAHFAIEHLRGKAVQRSESKQIRLTIESVLD